MKEMSIISPWAIWEAVDNWLVPQVAIDHAIFRVQDTTGILPIPVPNTIVCRVFASDSVASDIENDITYFVLMD